jgi:hypothetical protein
MTTYSYQALEASNATGYDWTDLKGNILKVPNPSWDPAIDDDKGRKLKEYLSRSGYDGPGDWNPA